MLTGDRAAQAGLGTSGCLRTDLRHRVSLDKNNKVQDYIFILLSRPAVSTLTQMAYIKRKEEG